MGFNRRKMEDQRRATVEKEAASQRATEAQVLEDVERLIAAWNGRQEKRMPMLFSRDDRRGDHCALLVSVGPLPGLPNNQCDRSSYAGRHRDAAVTSLIPAPSCRSCRPNAPFAELVRLSWTSIADEMREEHRRRVLGE
jgi:hypothetical protein